MARLFHPAVALLALTAVLIGGPIGSGGVAAAATGGGQESRLEREVDRLSAGERAQLVGQLSDRLAEAGIDFDAPAVQVRLARVLGSRSEKSDGRSKDRAVPSAALSSNG